MDRVLIRYQLDFTSPSHFGTGFRAGLVQRAVCRGDDGYLYVPGSTLKGALRERCEQLAALFRLKRHDPHGDAAGLAEFHRLPSIIDVIFGSRTRPARLSFDDAQLTADAKQLFDGEGADQRRYLGRQTFQRTQVGMSRITGTARSQQLYTSEFGLNGLSFSGSISGLLQPTPTPAGETPRHLALALLVAGLLALDRLGGSKSTGAGQLSCRLTGDILLNGEERAPAALLEDLVDLEWYDYYHEEAGQ